MAVVMTEASTTRFVTQPRQTNDTKFDRFRFGWRMTPRLQQDGRVAWERIPLTMQDILHPQVGDFRVHTDERKRFCVYLNDVIEAQVADDPSAVVLHDTRIAWGHPNVDPHGPDVALIFGVRQRQRWGTFDVIEEGTRPILIIEITSPETRHLDLEDKLDEYEQVGVEYYVIVDTLLTRRRTHYELIGHRLTPEGYVRMPANEQGWLWLQPAQIWIGLIDNQVTCFDEQRNRIGNYVEVSEALKEAEAQIEQAEQQASQARRQAEQAERRAREETEARATLEAERNALLDELQRLKDERTSKK